MQSSATSPPGQISEEASVGQAAVVEAASEALTDATSGAGPALLPRVLGDSPIAVLLIDRSAGAVTYANSAALELAGSVALPVPIDEWASKAGVTDVDGVPLGTQGALSFIASGSVLAGEAVRVRGTATAAGADRGTEDDRGPVVWVTGFALDGGDGDPMSLLVFLPVAQPTGDADPEQVLQALRERAVLATDMCLTMSDPRRPENPLIWVNPAFTRVTGYTAEAAVGRNCKFLQGPATDPAAIAQMVADLSAGRSSTVTLLNYRLDGTAFWNSVAISPVFDGGGELVSFVGVQSDVTERVVADAERAAAHAAEQRARHAADDARARMALLVEATTLLGESLDLAALQERLAGLYVPRLADWLTIAHLDEAGGVVTAVFSHHKAGAAARGLLAEVEADSLGKPFPDGGPSAEAVLRGGPVTWDGLTAETLRPFSRSLHGTETLDGLGAGSLVAIPLTSTAGTWGVLTLVRGSAEPFTDDDLEVAADLGRRAGQALDNARLYSRQTSVAETLQHALLPQLPDIPGITAAAHYTAAAASTAVGGDFYDLLTLPDDTIGIVIGDVAGHDITAAAAMGQLRGLIRSEAWAADAPAPSTVLTRVDRLLDVLHLSVIATAAVLRATPPGWSGNASDTWVIECGNAGHPPVLVRTPQGEVQHLCTDRDVLLGTGMAHLLPPRGGSTHEVPVGSQLLLYTDGLIEQPTPDAVESLRDLDAGLTRLQGLWSFLPSDLAPDAVVRALNRLVLHRADDIAMLIVQLGTPAGAGAEADDVVAGRGSSIADETCARS